jgi:hypothetical protein
MLPGHVLLSNMVWNAGDGPWWAAITEISEIYQALVSPSPSTLCFDSSKKRPANLYFNGRTLLICFIMFSKTDATPNGIDVGA